MELVIKRKSINYTVLIDDDDFNKVDDYFWHIDQDGYVVGYSKYLSTTHKKWVKMHRLVMDMVDDNNNTIDHINRTRTDNRKRNLRACSNLKNHQNLGTKGKSIYFGVRISKTGYISMAISFNNKRYYIHGFKTQEEAALAYNEFAVKLHGDCAKINIIENNSK